MNMREIQKKIRNKKLSPQTPKEIPNRHKNPTKPGAAQRSNPGGRFLQVPALASLPSPGPRRRGGGGGRPLQSAGANRQPAMTPPLPPPLPCPFFCTLHVNAVVAGLCHLCNS